MTVSDESKNREERLFERYLELDGLEELLEDMAALGVRSAEDAAARIEQLNFDIDNLEAADPTK